MIQTKDKFLSAAETLLEPRVVVDTAKGSLRARFFLIDGEILMPLESYPEVPRALFNGLRNQGILVEPVDGTLKVGGHRAFRIAKEDPKHGQKEEEI